MYPSTAEARGGIPFVYGSTERILKAGEFPNTEDFEHSSGVLVDPGWCWEQFHVFFIPVWNADGHWCGYVQSETESLSLNEEELKEISDDIGIALPAPPSLPFWDAVGGKLALVGLLIGVFILMILWSFIKDNKLFGSAT